MYKKATDEDFGFLYVELNARDKKRMLMVKYNSHIEIAED